MDSGMVEMRLIGPPEAVAAVHAALENVLRMGPISRKPSRYNAGDICAYGPVEPLLPTEAGPARRTTARRSAR